MICEAIDSNRLDWASGRADFRRGW